MDAESLARLRRNLQATDDEALIALSNRGLLRRAKKDLSQSAALNAELGKDSVVVAGDGWTVTMPPEGPVAASDDTSATGITRQILTAALFLRDHWPFGIPDTSQTSESSDNSNIIQPVLDRLVNAPNRDLFKWAGKTPVLEAANDIHNVGSYEIDLAQQLSVAFADANIKVVLLTDNPANSLRRLLDQFKTTCKPDQHARWVMQAVFALKQRAGKDIAVSNDVGPELTAAIVNDRIRVAAKTLKLLDLFSAIGVAHPSDRIVQRFQSCGLSAEAARFPRLARLLHSIADDIRLQIARRIEADSSRLIQRLITVRALAQAAVQQNNAEKPSLFGQFRSKYLSIGALELTGLGAYGWRTSSGYEGLTTVFWSPQRKEFFTVSASRGTGQDRLFSISNAYRSGIGWLGASPTQELCRHKIQLLNAKVNHQGRLSTSSECQVIMGAPATPTTMDFGDRLISDWSQLAAVASRSEPIGLQLPDFREAIIVLKPESWGQRWFDELEQAFVWEVADAAGRMVELRVPWTEVNENAVAFLEHITPDREKLDSLLGQLELVDGRLRVYPISLFSKGSVFGDQVLCPQLDASRIKSPHESLLQRLRKKFKRAPQIGIRVGRTENDEEPTEASTELAGLPVAIREVITQLDQLARISLESGVSAFSEASSLQLQQSCQRLESLGANCLAHVVRTLLESQRPDVLHLAYCVQLFAQSLKLSRLSS